MARTSGFESDRIAMFMSFCLFQTHSSVCSDPHGCVAPTDPSHWHSICDANQTASGSKNDCRICIMHSSSRSEFDFQLNSCGFKGSKCFVMEIMFAAHFDFSLISLFFTDLLALIFKWAQDPTTFICFETAPNASIESAARIVCLIGTLASSTVTTLGQWSEIVGNRMNCTQVTYKKKKIFRFRRIRQIGISLRLIHSTSASWRHLRFDCIRMFLFLAFAARRD